MIDEHAEKVEGRDGAESPAPLKAPKNADVPAVREVPRVPSNRGLNALNLFDEKQLAAAENFLTKVMRSKKGGIESVNDGLAILMRAQDLNLPFSTCIEHIHVINGRTGIDIHVVKALLLKAGITWRCIKDYVPLYEYTDDMNVYVDNSFPDYVVRCKSQAEAREKAKGAGEDDGKVYVYPVKWYQDLNGNAYRSSQLNASQFGIALNRQQIAEISKSGRTPVYRIPNKPVDYVTEYELTRNVNGKEVKSVGRFTYSEAVQAKMFEKDTYQKYPRILIGHRAFTIAARDIASDILMGAMETTELKIVSGMELSANDVATVEDAEAIEV